eukprot:252554-Chlamydomonas_euryale.AAC.2
MGPCGASALPAAAPQRAARSRRGCTRRRRQQQQHGREHLCQRRVKLRTQHVNLLPCRVGVGQSDRAIAALRRRLLLLRVLREAGCCTVDDRRRRRRQRPARRRERTRGLAGRRLRRGKHRVQRAVETGRRAAQLPRDQRLALSQKRPVQHLRPQVDRET